MPETPEVDDPEMKKFLALLERADRRSWRQFVQVLVALAMGVAIADIIALFFFGYFLSLSIH